MRPQQNRRMRGRGNSNNNNRKGPNPLTRSYESNGPDVKIRGTAQQVADKYAALARDAQSSGDRVIAENYLQHAEHYNRIIMTAQAQQQVQQSRETRDADDQDDRDDNFDNSANTNNDSSSEARNRPAGGESGSSDQPAIEGTPVEFAARGEDEAPRSRGRRKVNGTESGETAASEDNGAQGTAAEDELAAQKKPRRPRRPRKEAASSDDNGDADSPAQPDSEGSKESIPQAAQ